AVGGATDSSVTLSFTEVGDGAGGPASYQVRYAHRTSTRDSGPDVRSGGRASPLVGSAVGATRTCTVPGLVASTGYQFELVAFREIGRASCRERVLIKVAAGGLIATEVGQMPVASGVVTDNRVSHVGGRTPR